MSSNYIYNDINNVSGMQSKNTDKYSSPVNFNMGTGVLGSYDNILFQTQCNQGWKAPICDAPLKDKRIFLPQGTPLPLKQEEIYSELPTNSIFPFARTFASPDCRSMYSTDRGQLCLPETQQKYIGEMRGFNKTYENYNF